MKYLYKWKYHKFSDGTKELDIDLGENLRIVAQFLMGEVQGGLEGFPHKIEMMESARKDVNGNNRIGGNAMVCEMLGDKVRLIDVFAKEQCEIETLELYWLITVWVSGKYLHDEKGYSIDRLP